MRRAMLIVLFALFGSAAALTLGSAVAGASTGGPVGLDQSQSVLNRNSTSQHSDADAETKQRNVNLPIAVLSPGANQGDVSQSNEAATTAESGNANSTDQSVDGTSQDAVVEDGSRPGGDTTQSQDVANTNETSQDSSADATTKQQNVNLPIAVLSPGANRGDVDQSNAADTTATSKNDNRTDQSVSDTSQQAKVGDGRGGPGPGDVAQRQEVGNANRTEQGSEATATTEQENLNLPVTILGLHGGDRDEVRPSVPRKDDGCGCRDGWKPRPSHPSAPGWTPGSVEQSNAAATTATSANHNGTHQSVSGTSQQATVEGGKGGPGHDGPKGPQHDGPKGPQHDGPKGPKGGGDVSQHQVVGNANETEQDSSADATTKQGNVDLPFTVKSPGSKGHDVAQSNEAATSATSANRNGTDQSVSGTSQQATVEGGKGRPEHHAPAEHHRPEQHHPKHRPCPKHEPRKEECRKVRACA